MLTVHIGYVFQNSILIIPVLLNLDLLKKKIYRILWLFKDTFFNVSNQKKTMYYTSKYRNMDEHYVTMSYVIPYIVT